MIFLTELILFITTHAITGHRNDSSYSVIMNLKILPLVIRLTTKTALRYFDFRHDCQYGSFHCLKYAGLIILECMKGERAKENSADHGVF